MILSLTDKIGIHVDINTVRIFYEIIKSRNIDIKIDTYSLYKMIRCSYIDIAKYFIENVDYDF